MGNHPVRGGGGRRRWGMNACRTCMPSVGMTPRTPPGNTKNSCPPSRDPSVCEPRQRSNDVISVSFGWGFFLASAKIIAFSLSGWPNKCTEEPWRFCVWLRSSTASSARVFKHVEAMSPNPAPGPESPLMPCLPLALGEDGQLGSRDRAGLKPRAYSSSSPPTSPSRCSQTCPPEFNKALPADTIAARITCTV